MDSATTRSLVYYISFIQIYCSGGYLGGKKTNQIKAKNSPHLIFLLCFGKKVDWNFFIAGIFLQEVKTLNWYKTVFTVALLLIIKQFSQCCETRGSSFEKVILTDIQKTTPSAVTDTNHCHPIN